MRDRRDYVILGLVAALIFCVGLLAGQQFSVLPSAHAQDGFDPEQPVNAPGGPRQEKNTIGRSAAEEAGLDRGRTIPPTSSDSNSNNRFVAVTCPIGSGESVLFVLDAVSEQVTVYRYRRNKGLEFLAGRKIDYDLKINAYKDESQYTRDEMKELFDKQRARVAAKALKNNR